MFLENEGWELCPVKSNFSILQLLVCILITILKHLHFFFFFFSFFFFFLFFFFKRFIGPETNMVSVRVGAPISLPYNHIIF